MVIAPSLKYSNDLRLGINHQYFQYFFWEVVVVEAV